MNDSVNLRNWMDSPHNRWSFQHISEILNTVPISNTSGQVNVLPRADTNLDDVSFAAADGSTTSLKRHLDQTFCDSICVIHDGAIVYERYFNGMHQETPHLLMSVTKSVTAAALGIAIGRGLLSINDLVTKIAPEFSGTSLEGASIRHLIDMSAGTEFVEDYELYKFPDSDLPLIEYERQSGYRPLDGRIAIGALKHFHTYPLARSHGEVFDYRSPLTNVVARILEIVNGLPFNDVVSRDVWTPLGMEHSANIFVDPVGFTIADGAMSCTTRDLARFGLAYLNDGFVNGKNIIPKQWVLDTYEADDEASRLYAKSWEGSQFEKSSGSKWFAYHNAFWIIDRAAQFSGLGIFGQSIWIDRPSRTVIARFSTHPEASMQTVGDEELRGFAAIAQSLN